MPGHRQPSAVSYVAKSGQNRPGAVQGGGGSMAPGVWFGPGVSWRPMDGTGVEDSHEWPSVLVAPPAGARRLPLAPVALLGNPTALD